MAIRLAKLIFLAAVVTGAAARAADFSSTNFIVRDPVESAGGGYSTSDSFKLWSSISQPAIGTSSATSFQAQSGFLYFPAPSTASAPSPTPSAAVGGTGSGSVTTPIPPPGAPPPAAPPSIIATII